MTASAAAPYGLHWFRRDLRVAGNPALRWSWQEHRGRVLGLFCFDARFLARPDFSADRFAFFLKTIEALRDELRAAGGDLLVLEGDAEEVLKRLFTTLRDQGQELPRTVSWNRDYEPYARARDERLTTFLQAQGLGVHTARDHLLFEPGEIVRADGSAGLYQVYTPFAKRWVAALSGGGEGALAGVGPRRVAEQKEGLAWLRDRAAGKAVPQLFALTWAGLFSDRDVPPDQLDAYQRLNAPRVRVPIPAAGSQAAWRRLQEFKASLASYKEKRDVPAAEATSRLSMYLKNGSLTTAQVLAELGLGAITAGEVNGPTTFLRELAWREFFYQVLWFRPRVEREAFLPAYAGIPWENRETWFEAWKAGRTGYALVDAGMRELAATGFMHNRARMVVASFLVKDLLVDWRWGERYFMERLLDGDLAPNNGGWQWAASTGCDAQPYFRVFNPTLQGQRFDPTGAYIQRWVPERRALTGKDVHAPREPVVAHDRQKEKVIALFRGAAPGPGPAPAARSAPPRKR